MSEESVSDHQASNSGRVRRKTVGAQFFHIRTKASLVHDAAFANETQKFFSG
jgi:hypothetical protein